MPQNMIDRAGNVVAVPDDQVASAYQSGQLGFIRGEEVAVKNVAGTVGTVSAEDAAKGLAGGDLKSVSSQEYRKAALENEYGGVGGQVAAAGLGALDAATLGAGNAGIVGIGSLFGKGDDARRYVKNTIEANPIAHGVGQVGGMVGLALATGGAGLAGEGGVGASLAARAATAPSRLMFGAGRVAEGAVERLVGNAATSTLGRIGQRAATMAAEGAAEGALYGAGTGLSEGVLGDPDHVAEKILAGIGQGTIWGGLGGAALGTISGALSRGPVASIAEKEAASKFGEAAEGIGRAAETEAKAAVDASSVIEREATKQAAVNAVENAAATGVVSEKPGIIQRAIAGLTGKDADEIQRLTALTKEGKKLRSMAVYEGDAALNTAQREMRAGLDELHRTTRPLMDETQGALKEAQVRRMVSSGSEAVDRQVTASLEQLGNLEQMVSGMTKDRGYGQQANLNALRNHLRIAGDAVIESAAAGDSAKSFMAMDRLKRWIGTNLARPGANLARETEEGATAKLMRDHYDSVLKPFLENESLWGKAGTAQREINDAWTKLLGSDRQFSQRLMTEIGRDPQNAWQSLYAADPGKIASYYKELINPSQDLTHQLVKSHLDNQKGLIETIAKHYDLPAEQAAAVEGATKAIGRIQESTAKAEKTLVLANQLKQLDVAAPFLGKYGNPAAAIRALATAERFGTKIDEMIHGAAKGFIAGEETGAKGAVKRAATSAKETAETASHATGAATAEAAAATGGPSAPHEEAEGRATRAFKVSFDKAFEQVEKFTKNAHVAAERIGQTMGEQHSATPNVADAMTAKTVAAAAYLASKVPSQEPTSAIQPELSRAQLSAAEKREWLNRYRAASNPTSVLDDLRNHKLTPEAVEALRATSPRLYKQIQEELLDQVAGSGKRLSYGQQVQLSMMFGVPLDDTLRPDFVKRMQGSYPQQQTGGEQPREQPKQSKPRAKDLKIGDDYATATQHT